MQYLSRLLRRRRRPDCTPASGPTRSRVESNAWLRRHAPEIRGKILSIGSGDDGDREGGRYRDYFRAASRYTTSEVTAEFGCDLTLDIRRMPEIETAAFDCVFCSGVLEHVDDLAAAMREITRILAPGGVLLLGVPFRQAVHLAPHDYWRFTEFGLRRLLAADYELLDLCPVDAGEQDGFPAAYWAKARRRA